MTFEEFTELLETAAKAQADTIIFKPSASGSVIHCFKKSESGSLDRIGKETEIHIRLEEVGEAIKKNSVPAAFLADLPKSHEADHTVLLQYKSLNLHAVQFSIHDKTIKGTIYPLQAATLVDLLSVGKNFSDHLSSLSRRKNGITLINSSKKLSISDILWREVWPDAKHVSIDSENLGPAIRCAESERIFVTHGQSEPITAMLLFLEKLKDSALFENAVTHTVSSLVALPIKRQCGRCAKPSTISKESIEAFPVLLQELVPETYQFSRGCNDCGFTSYRGSTVIYAYTDVSDEMRKSLNQELSAQDLYILSSGQGPRSIYHAAIEMLKNGIVSSEELQKVLPPIPSPLERFLSSSPKSKINSRARTPGNTKILIVEDDEDQREVLKLVFKKEGYQVVTAENGREGLDCIQNVSFDLILSDIMMPVMNGKEFVAKLKTDTSTQTIPVLMLTASSNPEHEFTLLDVGADDYCAKNVQKKILLKRVERLLNRKASKGENPVQHLID